jgi:hypothetical protein
MRFLEAEPVINLLCHDLSRPALSATMPLMERETAHLRCSARVRREPRAATPRLAASNVFHTFIGIRGISSRAQCGSIFRHSLVCDGSRLRPLMGCDSVRANVYMTADGVRGQGSGGMGTGHASGAIEH